MQITAETWRKCAFEMKSAVIAKGVAQKWADLTNKNIKTVYKNARKYGYDSGKKTRIDKGKLSQYAEIQPDIESHLWKIAAIYHRLPKRMSSTRAESKTPLEEAIEIYKSKLDSKINLPSVSRIRQVFRAWHISKKESTHETQKRVLISKYPNHVHQYDTSICRYYLDPDNTILFISQAEDYKNKIFQNLTEQSKELMKEQLRDLESYKKRDAMKKRRLVRHVLIDHCTGAFFVYYSFHQKILDYLEFLHMAWKEKGEYIFHGAPEMLILDHDVGLRSYTLMRLYANLQIEIPAGKPYTPWEKGSVEGFNRIWERNFESRFLFGKSADLNQINQWAFDFAIQFQKKRLHRRHNMTRFHAWDIGISGHLREIPEKKIFMSLAHSKPKPAKVSSNRLFQYKGKTYEAPAEFIHQWVDVIIHPYLYQQNQAVTIFYPSEKDSTEKFLNTEIQKYTLLPVENTGIYRFNKSSNSVEFGNFIQLTPTESEKAFNKIDKTELPELEPFKVEKTDLEFLPKKGTKIMPDSSRSFDTIRYQPEQFKFALRDVLNRRLKTEEVAFIDALKKETFTEKDLEEFRILFLNGLLKEESQ